MVRPRTYQPEEALQRAVDVFAAKGYAETSMEDLVNATGVSRYGIYETFGNKREFFETSLERFAENMGKRSFLRLLEPEASLEHIRQIFSERIEDMMCDSDPKGCLLIHTAMELAPKDKELQGVLQRFMKRMTKAFAIGLESAKDLGEIRDDLDIRAAATTLTGTMFGVAVMGRVGFPAETLTSIVDTTLMGFKA